MSRVPIISIIIATYNSAKTLSLTLESIKKQDYPKNKIEVLIVDGGSTDCTRDIAKQYSCRIINNPKKEPLFAKHLGILKATGRYVVYLDSDEVMKFSSSLKQKISIFKKDNKIRYVIPSGYQVPPGFPLINYYINELGDPFSFFIYRLSKGADTFIPTLRGRYRKIFEDKECVVFNFHDTRPLPFIELGAMGSMIDLDFLKSNYPAVNKDLFIAPFLFYFLNTEKNNVAFAKNDIIFHYSSEAFLKYLKKINSRVKNNIFKTDMGISGFSGRDLFQPVLFRLKRYLFIPYAITIIFPLIDAINLCLNRKRAIYLIHPLLCIYTVLLIIYYYFLNLLNVKPKILSYGN